jgi:hypothetical protein
VLWASQNATVATSFSIGISMEQSLPSNKATSGRVCIGPFDDIGPRTASKRARFGIIFVSVFVFVYHSKIKNNNKTKRLFFLRLLSLHFLF